MDAENFSPSGPSRGNTGKGIDHFKPLFPAFYCIAFAGTLYQQFMAQLQMPPPLLLNVVKGEANQLIIWGVLYLLIGILCISLFANYVRLELFDDAPCVNTASRLCRAVEFGLRAAILSLVAAKLLHWGAISNILLFVTLLSMLQFAWSIWISKVMKEPASIAELALHFCSFLFSGSAYLIARNPFLQETFGMGLFAIWIIMIIALGVQLCYISITVGPEAIRRAESYARSF